MARGVYVVRSRPVDPAREDDFNHWYDGTHVPELLSVPGFRSARRFRRDVDVDGDGDGDGPVAEYLAVYEIEADDVAAPVEEWRRRSAAGETTRTDALQLDPPPAVGLYEELA